MTRWRNRTIGILGGFGAAAAARCFTQLIRECQRQGAMTDTDFPSVILYSTGSSGLDEKGVCDEKSFKDDLWNGVVFLEKSDVDVILIACNTAYLYYDYLSMGTTKEIVHLPKVAINHCAGNRYGVLCSRTTRDTKLYGEAIYCDDKEQEQVDDVIRKVMAGQHTARDRVKLENIVRAMRERGAQLTLLGCTELPLCGGDIPGVIDPMTIAIQEALE